jgi:hypothetical protein
MKKPVQLELPLFPRSDDRGRSFAVTRVLKRHRAHQALLRKLAYVRRFFPELDGTPITVGLTRAASGMAVPGGKELWFNPAQISYHTIAHEFVHLLQGDNGLPKSERSCDLHSLARHWTLNDARPCYVKIPKTLLDERGTFPPESAMIVYDAAVEGLRMRENGERNYIMRFEENLAAIAAALGKSQ